MLFLIGQFGGMTALQTYAVSIQLSVHSRLFFSTNVNLKIINHFAFLRCPWTKTRKRLRTKLEIIHCGYRHHYCDCAKTPYDITNYRRFQIQSYYPVF